MPFNNVPRSNNSPQQARQDWQQLFQQQQQPQKSFNQLQKRQQRCAQPGRQEDNRQLRVRKCWNCDQPGHHWTYCTVPLNVEKVKRAKELMEQMRKGNNRVRFVNSFPKQSQDATTESNKGNPIQNDLPTDVTKKGIVHRLKSGGNQGYQEVTIEVYSESYAQFINVDGVLDSGTRLNVAPMSLFKYCAGELQLTQENYFCTPTGQVISAEKYGILRLRLRTSQGNLSLGRCRVFFMGGTWRKLLIGDNTLKHFGISPKTAVLEKIQEAKRTESNK